MTAETTGYYRHGLLRMRGRDIAEPGRVSSPLELLFDLVFAASFGVVGAQLAHGIAAGHAVGAIGAFALGGVAVVWAWINFSWFASAFDTDDWLFRITTMLQMAGVIVLTIGLPQMFASIESGGTYANRVMVAGYIVMRLALIVQWLRASRDERYRRIALTYVAFVSVAQVGWVAIAWLPLTVWQALAAGALCWLIEFIGPITAERRHNGAGGRGTPWHPEHIAERYSLLVIVTLGETVIGTITAAQEVVGAAGWTFDTVIVIGSGIALSFALWWTYFLVPSAPVLRVRRDRSVGWGYGHGFLFLSIAAVGAGLHVIGSAYDTDDAPAPVVAVAALAVPVFTYTLSLFTMNGWLTGTFRTRAWVQAVALGAPACAIAAAAIGAPLWVCVLIVLAGPVSLPVSYEAGGWRAIQARLDEAVTRAADDGR